MNVWDLRLQAGAKLTLPAAEGWNTAVVILHGSVRINEQVVTNEAQLALLERSGNDLIIEAYNDSVVLLLSGEPIDEPIAGHGPFVMNTEQEIANAISDFENGRFGQVHK